MATIYNLRAEAALLPEGVVGCKLTAIEESAFDITISNYLTVNTSL